MDDYYTAPSQEIFEDIKTASINIRNTYDDEYGYASEKIARVESMDNIQDNALCIIGMFDIHNQLKLLQAVELPTKQYIVKHME
jgi:F0F1-type ATP synthase gamma subunit